MVHVLVHHKVKDYTQWKEVFDEHAKVRKELGSKEAEYSAMSKSLTM